MGFLDYILGNNKKRTADIAVERLQMIVAYERKRGQEQVPEYIQQLRKEIIDVVSKYIKIDSSQIKVSLEKSEDYDILELNIPLPEDDDHLQAYHSEQKK